MDRSTREESSMKEYIQLRNLHRAQGDKQNLMNQQGKEVTKAPIQHLTEKELKMNRDKTLKEGAELKLKKAKTL